MMKIFYYPSLNKLRHRSLNVALVISTLIVFAGTWVLHSYQWFWLQGTFPLTATDALFWGILGIMVVVNSVHEATRGRRRTLKSKAFSWNHASLHALKVAGMLIVITILWTLWSSHAIGEFLSLMRVAANGAMMEWLVLGGAIVLLIGVGVLVQYAGARGIRMSLVRASLPIRQRARTTSVLAGVLIFMALPELHGAIGPSTAAMIAPLQRHGLNTQDEQRQLLGYYEGLLDSRGFMAAQWNFRGKAQPPADWGDLSASVVTRETDDIRRYELRPYAEDTLFHASFKVNRWGMRDRDYEFKKLPGTFRIAVIGASYAVGAGVEQDETFEALIEDRLNRNLRGGPYDRIESLNFAVGGYDPLRVFMDVKLRLLEFEPDMVYYIGHTNDGWRLIQNLVSVIKEGIQISDPHVQTVILDAGVNRDMPRTEISRRLDSYVPGLLQWSYRSMSELFRERGIEHVAFVLPRVIDAGNDKITGLQRTVRHLRESGFKTYNIWDVYGEMPVASLWLGPWDEHPNLYGHRLIADRILQELMKGGHLNTTRLLTDEH